MKAKELITKVLVGNPKTIVSVFAMMLLICGIQGIGYALPPMFDVQNGDPGVAVDGDGVVTLSVSENQATTNVGGILDVISEETALNDSHYNLRDSGNRHAASFRLRAVEGGVRLVTRNALDRETQTDYEVIITVRDNIANNGGSRFAVDDEITVIITVTNDPTDDDAVVNSAPVFGDGPSTTRSVPENTDPEANIVGAVVATDPNTGDTWTYTLGGTDRTSFAIDAETGQLKTLAPLDYEDQRDYEVTVTATDDGTGNLSDTIWVTIMVTNVNDAPEFPATIAPIVVVENTVAAANIGAPVVADDDDGDTLMYELDLDAVFAIDPETGQLKTLAALDYEDQRDYEVMVTATDDGTGRLSDEIRVIIRVTNDPADDAAVVKQQTVLP